MGKQALVVMLLQLVRVVMVVTLVGVVGPVVAVAVVLAVVAVEPAMLCYADFSPAGRQALAQYEIFLSMVGDDDPRLADYSHQTDVALKKAQGTEHGLYIAESALVLGRALRAGHRPRSRCCGWSAPACCHR